MSSSPGSWTSGAARWLILPGLLTLFACEEGDTIVEGNRPLIPTRIELVAGNEQAVTVSAFLPVPPTVRVLSDDGVPVSNTQVVFDVVEGVAYLNDAIVATDAAGHALAVARLGPTAGPVVLTATVPGLAGSPVTFDLIALAGSASRLTVLSGDHQTHAAGEPLPEPVVIAITDGWGNPVAGVPVVFTPESDAGSVDPEEITTGEDGLATTSWTLGPTPGEQRLVFESPEVPGFPQVVEATAVAGAAARLSIIGGDDQGGSSGDSLAEPFVVEVRDAFDNLVGGATVHFEVVEGSGTLSATDVVTLADGTASTTLTLGATGEVDVRASADDAEPVMLSATSYPATSLDAPTSTILEVTLSWTADPAPGFERYEVRRSLTHPVTLDSPLVAVIEDAGTTTARDPGYATWEHQYYRVFTLYESGHAVPSNQRSLVPGVAIDLPSGGWDLVADPARGRAYVSTPTTGEIVILSTETYDVADRLVLGGSPRGLDLSLDGRHLFIALNDQGAIGVLDLDASTYETIPIETDLDSERAYDVVNVQPDVLVATASPGSFGLAFVVRVDLDFVDGHESERIAGGRIIRTYPTLAAGPAGEVLYVGEASQPQKLLKLDMISEGNPVTLERNNGVWGVTDMAVGLDGTHLFLESGQVIATHTFARTTTLHEGFPLVTEDGARVYLGGFDEVVGYDATTFVEAGRAPVPEPVTAMVFTESGDALLVLCDDRVYGMPRPVEGTPAPF